MNKVTKEAIEAKIKDVSYKQLTGKITHCIITLENGYEVTGESSCVDPKIFDLEIGKKFAYEEAFKKLWPLEGYLLQEKIHLKSQFEQKNSGSLTSPDEALSMKVLGEVVGNEMNKRVLFGNPKYSSPTAVEREIEKQAEHFSKRVNDLATILRTPDGIELTVLDGRFHFRNRPEQYWSQPGIKLKVVFNFLKSEMESLQLPTDENVDSNVHEKAKMFISLIDGSKLTKSERWAKMKFLFDLLFPHAPKEAFDLADGRVMLEKNLNESVTHPSFLSKEQYIGLQKKGILIQEAPVQKVPVVDTHKKGFQIFMREEDGHCLRWNGVNDLGTSSKKKLFLEMFPKATDGDFHRLEEEDRVLLGGKTFKGLVADAVLLTPEYQFKLLKEIFPGMTQSDFQKLESRQQITDEASFTERYISMQQLRSHRVQAGDKEAEKEFTIVFNKLVRQEVDIIIQSLKASSRKSPERSTAIRKLTEGVMWIGMDLKDIGTPNPYPESKNPANTTVEPTADGLKL